MTADDPATGRPWSLKQLEWRCHELLSERKQKPPLPDECVVPRAALRALIRVVRSCHRLHGMEDYVPDPEAAREHAAAVDAFEVLL
jgi:hypothetical protein